MQARLFIPALIVGLLAGLLPASNARADGKVWAEWSREYLELPTVHYLNRYFTSLTTGVQTIDELVNDDGQFDGNRFDVGVDGIPVFNGTALAGIEGFYARHHDSSDLQCDSGLFVVPPATPTTGCTVPPLIDTNSNVLNAGLATGGTRDTMETERSVDHWGVSVKVSAPGALSPRAGLAFRRIDQDMTITAREIIPNGIAADPYQLTYREDLNTNYLGAFVGGTANAEFGNGWKIIADGDAGLYWADTDYSGSYAVINSVALASNISQQLALEDDRLAFIGTVKLSLEKDFGPLRIAGFGRAEYISSSPSLGYNDVDLGPGINITGPDNGTRLENDYAFAFSFGGRVTVPFGEVQ